jgi:uncharacterized protein GlcG (DUF336 family)
MAEQVTLEGAGRVIEACTKKAEAIGTPMSVAVADGRAVAFGGGIPLTDEDGRVVGGVGVSGGSPEEDHDVAAAGAAAF